MRLYVNLVGSYTVVSISHIYYDSSESQLRFCTISGDWFKLKILDSDRAFDILSEIFADGVYDLSDDYIAYPFAKSDYLEE